MKVCTYIVTFKKSDFIISFLLIILARFIQIQKSPRNDTKMEDLLEKHNWTNYENINWEHLELEECSV